MDEQTGCWLWLHRLNGDGRPLIAGPRGNEYAYRMYYERAFGPVPAPVDLHHECHNKHCVNPRHLTPLSHSEHRTRHATPRRFSERDIQLLYELHGSGMNAAGAGRQIGMSPGYAQTILSGKSTRSVGRY